MISIDLNDYYVLLYFLNTLHFEGIFIEQMGRKEPGEEGGVGNSLELSNTLMVELVLIFTAFLKMVLEFLSAPVAFLVNLGKKSSWIYMFYFSVLIL